VAGVGKEHAMAAQSVIPRETKSTREIRTVPHIL